LTNLLAATLLLSLDAWVPALVIYPYIAYILRVIYIFLNEVNFMSNMVRMSLNISPQMAEKLEKMSEESHSSKSDVLRKALILMDIALDSQKEGLQIAIVDKDGKKVSGILGL
jgi:hypothetical protein